jgi:mRNA interferase MazF
MSWIPKRQEVIWINFSPKVGVEMKNLHPFLVLSDETFNDKTSLVIGLPMTTASYNKSNPFALNIGNTQTKSGKKPGYILCQQPKSFDWRKRQATKHSMGKLTNSKFDEACAILNQITKI